MSKPRLLDLFAGAGGAARGYQQAGFYVVGVDIEPQPRYGGDEFVQSDALGLDLEWVEQFDAIHASPPCQAHSAGKNMWKGRLPDDRHPDLIPATRDLLRESGLPFVMENVAGAPLLDYVVLCGDPFGLGVRRHRLFETSFHVWAPPRCRSSHPNFVVSVFGGGALSRTPRGGSSPEGTTGNFMQRRVHVAHERAKVAMGVDWMTRDELSQAIPPAYTAFLGSALLDHLTSVREGV